MSSTNRFQYILFLLVVFSLGLMIYKARYLRGVEPHFLKGDSYQVTYRFFFKTDSDPTVIKAYLPQTNSRQRISTQKSAMPHSVRFTMNDEAGNLKGQWSASGVNQFESISYSFIFTGKDHLFGLSERFAPLPPNFNPASYLLSTDYIQSAHPGITALADSLRDPLSDRKTIQQVFDRVHQIPSAPIISRTDALSALERNEASCNGKSRLFVALIRNLGYPARIKGGIILSESNKRTSHAWAEVFINGIWVPFDPLNGHFAYLPSNYLELYKGDEFMITHSPGIEFDYAYEIEKQRGLPVVASNEEEVNQVLEWTLFHLVKEESISQKNLLLLLFLPLGGLLVALLRNVVGLKTFGVFLPVLITFSLLEVGFAKGILLFVFLILFVGIISRPFDRMRLLHTPKLVISLTLMVLVMVIGQFLGLSYQIPLLGSITLFPTIILTISAERFSQLVVEDGFSKATSTLFQTLLAVGVCYLFFQIQFLEEVLIFFPEVLLLSIGGCMLLGRYIGLRWTEIFRFKPLLTPQMR